MSLHYAASMDEIIGEITELTKRIEKLESCVALAYANSKDLENDVTSDPPSFKN
jgi:hypothetical protein